jgi:hypothetical protein
LIKEQSVKLEGAAGALEEVMVQAKSKADLTALSNRKEREELIDQFDRVRRQNSSLSDTLAVHVDKATKLTTTVAQQGFTIAKFKQHAVVTADGQGQQVANQAEMEAMRDEFRVGMEQVKNDLGQQIKSVSHAHMSALEKMSYQTAQMVARENGAMVDRVEQCIEMVAPHMIMSGPEPRHEWVPRQALSGAQSLEVLAANRLEIGTCVFQMATFVEERAKVFLLHGALAIRKRHISYVVLNQMQRELHDVNLSGIQDETHLSSSFWIASLRENRCPDYKGCHDSWRDVSFDRHGNVRKKPPKGVYATPEGRRTVNSGPLSQTKPEECKDIPTKKMFGTMRKEHRDRQCRRQSSNDFKLFVDPARVNEGSDGAATETTADEGGSDEESEGEILSGADQKSRRQAGSQASRGNPLVADEAEFTGSSGQESDVSSVYDGVADVGGDLAREKNFLIPYHHHLSDIQSQRIKRKSEYAVKVAVALYKAFQSFVKDGKVPRRQVTAVIDAWEKEPEVKELSSSQLANKAAFKAEKDLDDDYEELAWEYFGNGHDDGRPHENIYLMNFKKRTLRQVFNLLRSKLVFESRLQKTDGKTTSWHTKARPFHDGSVDVEALLEFAKDHTDFPLGNEGARRKDQYPNELLPTYKGMTKLDWCRRAWMDLRKMKFDAKGRLNGKRVSRKQAKKVTIVVKPTRAQGSGDESTGSMDLLVSDNDDASGDSDGCERMKSNPYEALRSRRVKKVTSAKKGAVSTHGDSGVVIETEREKELMNSLKLTNVRVKMAEDETQKSDDKVDAMELKLQGTDRQKLPCLVADRLTAHESAERFRTTMNGNHYVEMQVVTQIYAQALDKKPHVVEGGKEETTEVPYSYRRPAEMLRLVSALLNKSERAKK